MDEQDIKCPVCEQVVERVIMNDGPSLLRAMLHVPHRSHLCRQTRQHVVLLSLPLLRHVWLCQETPLLLHRLWQRACEETKGESYSELRRQQGRLKEDVDREKGDINMPRVRC